MDYAKIASQVIELSGGKGNIRSVAHCATRLRLQLRNNDLRNEEAISDVEGVKGVFLTQSQFQIIFGAGLVNLICDEVQKQLGTVQESREEEPEEKGNAVQRFIKMLSDIFVPIIPAIVAGGLLMGLNNLLTSPLIGGQSLIELYPQWQGLASAINTFANAPFTFLPVLIGFSATKKFGGNPFLGAAMGMIMVHPDLLNAYQIGVAQAPVWNIFGFEIAAIGYQGTVLPVLAVAWILATIEKRLHKVSPTWLDNLTTPLLSILITSFMTFIFVGPILRQAGNLLAAGITWTYNTLGPVGGALFGFVYAPITMTGMHHSFIAIETQLLANSAQTGGSFIFSTASMNNVAQGAAVLAVLLMTKNEKIKSICSASGISALLGITEPAMFGVTLKLKYPFYAAMTGSAVGSAYLAGTRTLAQALGAAGLPGFISMKPDHYLNFAIGLALSMAVSFGLTIVFWKKFGLERQDGTGKQAVGETGTEGAAAVAVGTVEVEGAAVAAGTVEAEGAAVAARTVKAEGTAIAERAVDPESPAGPERTPAQFYSPMNGRILPVSQSADEMFASRALGDGIAVDPADGLVCAPCDGTVTMIFPTGHAMGIASDSGFEVLIHAGIDTVKLNGEGFEVFVEQGKHVKKGDRLLRMDLDFIRSQGLNPQTMMIFTEGAALGVEVFPAESGGVDHRAVEVRRK